MGIIFVITPERPESKARATRGNSTGKLREFTGLNMFLFPLDLEPILKMQCGVSNLQKRLYPRRFFSRVETRADVGVNWRHLRLNSGAKFATTFIAR